MEQSLSLPLKHWGFERWPFRGTPTPQQLYPTAGSTEAIARIDFLVDGRRRLGTLVGESGVGKSLILQAAAKQLTRRGKATVLIDATGATTRDFLQDIAGGLAATPHPEFDNARLWRRIADQVSENRLQQIDTVLFVDEAGNAGPDVLQQIVRLTRLDLSAAARWTIVLASEPAQAARWNEAMRDLVDLRIELSPWESEDTVGYVQTALVDAGRFEPLFEDRALARLHELAAGIPRRVAKIADYALLTAAAAGLDVINESVVEAADEELAWPVEMGASAF